MPLADLLPADSWFRKWMACWPWSEPPKSFILLGAMSALGAILGRRVYLEVDPGVTRLYPMLNILLIGPSGIGKSQSMEMAWRLFQEGLSEDAPQIIRGSVSMERLHQDLSLNPKAVIFASELTVLFGRQDYLSGLLPYVTELLDYGPIMERRLKSEVVRVVAPEPTIIGCSTVELMQEHLPDSANAGGFYARFLIITEEHKGQRNPFPALNTTPTQLSTLRRFREEVAREFQALAQLQGEITFDSYRAADLYTLWETSYRPPSGHLEPFAARARVHILRVAMLVAVSSGRMRITEEDVSTAIGIYEHALRKLDGVVVPFTGQGKLLKNVLDAIGRKELTLKQVRRAMRNITRARDVDDLVNSLVLSGDIERTTEGILKRKDL